MSEMRIVFLGTPEFAVPSFRALIGHGYNVVGAFTQPDRPAGRGHKLAACPVKLEAEKAGVPVFQFQKIRSDEGVLALEALAPDLVVTAAFGQILSQKVLDIPKIGTVNVHASLLPAYRGAAPVNWCLIEGEVVTGVTTMMTDKGIDTGDILLQRELAIDPEENAEQLLARLSGIGAELLIETLEKIEAGSCPRTPQDAARASYFPMLKKEMGQIDFAMSPERVVNRIRGLNPWPGTYALMPEGALKIHKARPVALPREAAPGEIVEASAKKGLVVACGGGAVEILEMQAPNAKPMTAKAYLAGKSLPVGYILNEVQV
jgi:methionyl-tRNA formyltransferase